MLRHAVRRHPLAAFFALACAISWLLWAPLWLPRIGVAGLPVLPYHHSLGAFGPAVAAFVVALFHAAVDVVFTSDIASPLVVNAAGALITVGVLAVAGPHDLARAGEVVRSPDRGAVTAVAPRHAGRRPRA
jgi:hypothetical protein